MPKTTVHTDRTIMFKELFNVIEYSLEDDSYQQALNLNVINKATSSGVKHTSKLLKRLYDFDTSLPHFKAFKIFWRHCDISQKSKLALLYAVGNDYHLEESITIISSSELGAKITVDVLEENIEKMHPNRYSLNTKKSMSQNLVSSWKQAGFISGKVKNIRTQPEISYLVVTFALFLAYLKGFRGDFILKSIWVKALCLDEKSIRSLAVEAAKRDLLQYQYAGNVTSITFKNLLNKLNINGFEN